jgi:hypothetical protein
MAMTNKRLQEVLSQYPDESNILIFDNNYSDNKDISGINVDYYDGDNYEIPVITLK